MISLERTLLSCGKGRIPFYPIADSGSSLWRERREHFLFMGGVKLLTLFLLSLLERGDPILFSEKEGEGICPL